MTDFHLKVFLTVAKMKSFTRAAELLNLSQPAVTHQIKNLEKMFKAPLFDRIQNRIYLTKSGEALLGYADQIDLLYKRAQKEILQIQNQVSGDVHIGAAALLGKYLLPRVIGNFKKTYPDANLSMLVGNSKEILDFLREELIEIAIASEPISPSHLIAFPLYRDQLTVIVYPSHPWGEREEIGIDDLFSEDFISRETGSGTREVYKKSLESHLKGKKLRTTMVLGSTEAVKMGVIGEMGFSIVSRLACRTEVKLGLLKEIRLKDLEMKRDFFVVSNPDKCMSVPALKLKEYLKNIRDEGKIDL